MPIRPPNLDDRRYEDIVREARALIPQYCPEWTNLGDADPGMTLVQLFAWMTEMIIYRLNRVPDKTYVHFLNFIGEERRDARAATVPLTFQLRGEGKSVAEIPPYTRCSTKQTEGVDALHFLTTEPVTVHDANVTRIVAVKAGMRPQVREIPFDAHQEAPKALLFGGGSGVQIWKMDPIEHGPRSYTPYQFLYVAHDDFRLMNYALEDGTAVGRLRIRSADAESLPVAAVFKWEYYTGDMEEPWVAVELDEDSEEEVLGLPEIPLKTHLPSLTELDHFGIDTDRFGIPKPLDKEKWWIRGTVDYERWLAHRMQDDLEISWADDRGGEERSINNWDVRATGRYLEFFIQDMPPIRGGWTVRFTMIDRSMNAGRNSYLPRYKWMYRRGSEWEVIPNERVRYQDTSVVLTGPMNDMASDGYNLRAERVETAFLRGFITDLDLDLTWLRPVELFLAAGPETGAAAEVPTWELPTLPFQPAPTLPPLLGMKFFVGSDIFENRAQKKVMVEIEVGFEWEGEPIEEPSDLYHMQLTYRAADTWRVVWTDEGTFQEFTWANLDPEGALQKYRRKILIELDPRTQLKGLHRAVISGRESTWLRLELSRSTLTKAPKKNDPPTPITMKIHAVTLGYDGQLGKKVYEQPMPGPKMATVEYRDQNRRLSRTVTRSAGRLAEDYPFDTFIDISDDAGVKDKKDKKDKAAEADGHQALYFHFDKPFPRGQRHTMLFKTRGETYLPEDISVDWQILEKSDKGRVTWGRLVAAGEESGVPDFMMNRTGTMAFNYPDPKPEPGEGTWLRAIFRAPPGEDLPAWPPVSHVMLNTVTGINLHAFRMEKFSGLGVPHQPIQLRRFPVFLHKLESDQSEFTHPDRFADMRVFVTEDDGVRREWRKAPGNSILTATKDDRVFIIDPVEGTLTFGNGIRGRMLPVGNFNVAVEVYHTIPGDAGNVRPGAVAVVEGYGDIASVLNLLPATGGRNAESIEEIIRRAPSILTSRDRAVTRADFEIIAGEASGEVARAACEGKMGDDGVVGVVILPQRREGEVVPDPFLSAGLKEHVQRYLGKRCLVNVTPEVRLATFLEVDVSLHLRLRPNANILQVRYRAQKWVENFLDAYTGGLDGKGWPFHGTLFAQDFGRMVSDIAEVRHVTDVQLFSIDAKRDNPPPGWEEGSGLDTLVLDKHDLFAIRKVRVMSEDGGQ